MNDSEVDRRFRGPWPAVGNLIAAELDRYMADAAVAELRTGPSGCQPWSGDELTAHLVETFRRFTTMLDQSRSGDFTPPFERSALSAANLKAVAAYDGDPLTELRPAVEAFCRAATDPDEPMAHQFGPIPTGLQATFGLAELALHHDDLVSPAGRRYRPSTPLVALRIAASYEVAMEITGLAEADDPWNALLLTSGRQAETGGPSQ